MVLSVAAGPGKELPIKMITGKCVIGEKLSSFNYKHKFRGQKQTEVAWLWKLVRGNIFSEGNHGGFLFGFHRQCYKREINQAVRAIF